MFDHKQYVPVLKWKRGERVAIRNLSDKIRGKITPLIEFIPRNFDANNIVSVNRLKTIVQKRIDEIAKNWGSSPFFLDFCQIVSNANINGTHIIYDTYLKAVGEGLSMIPVIDLHPSESFMESIKKLIKKADVELCLRLYSTDIKNENINAMIKQLCESLNRVRTQFHLVIDYQSIHDNAFDLIDIDERIERLDEFRTYTVASGAFPSNLTGFTVGQHVYDRTDWISWRNQIEKVNAKISRLPSYADYTILNPHLPEFPFFPNVSASIRYTYDEYWVIMRGEGLRNPEGPGRKQYPAQASLLCSRAEYAGNTFSDGDNYINSISLKIGESVGSPEKLIQVGINHHITYVVQQLADFFRIRKA